MKYNDKQIHLLETAERLFATKGYAGTSIRDIAEKGKLNPAMIYHYFGSKEKLMEAILEYRTTNLSRFLNQLLYSDLSPSQKFRQLLQLYIDKAIQQKYYYALLIQVQLLGGENDIINLFYKFRERNYRLLKTIVSAGQKKGIFKNNIDVSLLIGTIAGTINHLVLNQKYYRNLDKQRDLTEEEFMHHFRDRISAHLKGMLEQMLWC